MCWPNTFYKKLTDLPPAKDLENDGHQLVIFDDCVADKNQEKISDYFLYGRKINNNLGCSCIYISQRYFGIPQIVRGQLNYMILLKVRGFRDLKLILRDANLGIEVEKINLGINFSWIKVFFKKFVKVRGDSKLVNSLKNGLINIRNKKDKISL